MTGEVTGSAGLRGILAHKGEQHVAGPEVGSNPINDAAGIFQLAGKEQMPDQEEFTPDFNLDGL